MEWPIPFDECDSFSSLSAFPLLSGFIWSEIKQLWDVGLREYVNDMWNVVDFVTNALYVATVALRLVAYYRVSPMIVRIVRPY